MAKLSRFRVSVWRRGAIATGATVALVASLAVPVSAQAEPAAGPQRTVVAKIAPVKAAADEVSASVDARAQGSRVEVLSERTESSETFVNPDGSFTSEVSDGIARVRDVSAAGGWRTVDLDLKSNSDGTFSPMSPVDDLELNGGGAGSAAKPLLTLKKTNSQWLSLGWVGGDLPKPTIDGNTATYKDVRPGVDLLVQATRTGFEQSLVLHSAPANPADARVTLPITAHGLDFADHGDSDVSVTAAGKTLGGVGRALVSDASVNPGTHESENASAAHVSVATVGGKRSLVVTPDAEYLASAQYPVTVDPSVSLTPSSDTYVDSAYPNENYASDTMTRAGTWNSGTNKDRAFIKWNTSVAGTQILSSTMKLWENSASSCTASSFTVYPADPTIANPDITWNHQPTVYTGTSASVSTAVGGGSGCPAAWVSVNTKALVQYWADQGKNTFSFTLRASETSDTYYKRWDSANSSHIPTLSITYNRYSSAPSSLALSDQVTGSGTTYTTSLKPVTSGRSTDPDGDNVTLEFQVFNAASATSAYLVSNCYAPTVASGATASCTSAALSDNTTYWYRAGSADPHMTFHEWSGLQKFVTASAKPTTPTLTCASPYTNGSWATDVPTAPVACTVTVVGSSASTGPKTITATVDGVESTFTVASSGTTTGNLTVPAKAGSHTITATTTSVVGTTSNTATYTLGYGSGAITSPASGQKTTGTVTVKATAPPRGSSSAVTAQLQWAGPGVDWTDIGSPSGVTPALSTDPVIASFNWDTTDATGGTINPRLMTTLQLRILFAYTGGSTLITPSETLLRVPHAFDDGYPTAEAGDGTVALWTGELETSSDDVSVATNADILSVSRDYASFASPTNSVTGVFGPGWSASLDGSGAGYSAAEVDDENATLTSTSAANGSLTLAGTDDGDLVYAPPTGSKGSSPTGVYTAVDSDTLKVNNKVIITSVSGVKSLSVTQIDGTISTWQLQTVAGVPTWVPTGVAAAGQQGATTYSTDTQGRVTRILGAVPVGVTCPAVGVLNPGCSALNVIYASSTTATTSAPGDFMGQVKQITYTGYNPAKSGGAGVDTVVVASYTYDTAGRLITFTDRYGVTTTYQYQSAGELTLLAQSATAGSAAYLYVYDSGTQKLTSVKRGPAVSGGSNSVIQSFAYGLSPSTSGMPNLSATQIQAWGQTRVPTKAFAVFGADHLPAATPTASDLPYAALSFTDDDGYTTNTASYGAGQWLLTDQEYDTDGTPTVSLDAQNINDAITATTAGDTYVPADDETVTRYAAQVDSGTEGDDPVVPGNTIVEDTWSAPYEATLADGTVETVRQHTHYEYDQGAPASNLNPATGKPYLLQTKVTIGVTDADNTSTDPAVALPADDSTLSSTAYGYDPIDGASATGPTSGWTLGQPTVITKIMPGASNIVTKTLFDAQGNTIKTLAPDSTGSDAGTTVNVNYTAGTNSADAACGNEPQWAGLECWSGPAAAPTTGVDLTDSRITGYTMWLDPARTVATSGSGSTQVTRTTTATYLSDGREDTEAVAVTGLTGSEPVPTVKALYDPTTKARAGTGIVNSSGTVTSSDISSHDLWGRQVAYTNSLGDETDTSYIAPGNPGAGQVHSITTPKSTGTYTYDGTDADGKVEHRGLATALTVSGVGSYSAAYDINGALETQNLPAGLSQSFDYDHSGRLSTVSYTGDITADDGTTTTGAWLSFSRDYDTAGRVGHDWSPDGTSNTPTGYTKAYSYDNAGRLTAVDDAADPDSGLTRCTIRQYTFDNRGNRTNLASTTSDTGCTTTGTTVTTTRAYDAQSRQLTGANGAGPYVYDGLGRQTTIPASDAPDPANGNITIGYYDSDAAHTITQGTTTTTYSLDPDGRRLTESTAAGSSTSTVSNHYGDDGDSPLWANSMDGSAMSTTVYSTALAGGLSGNVTTSGDSIAATLDLADPAGNVVATATIPSSGHASGVIGYSSFDEYGNPANVSLDTGVTAYGWLGAAQRAVQVSGLLLMGARLYNPATGRFTSVDPTIGGNENSYNYPDDPINLVDISGRLAWLVALAVFDLSMDWNPLGWVLAAVIAIIGIVYLATLVAEKQAKSGIWKSKSKHAKSRQGQRGISDEMVDQAVRTGKKTKGNKAGTTKHIGRKIWVVTDRYGKIISVGWN